MKVLTDIDLQNNLIENGGFKPLASAPVSPVIGQSYFDTTLGYERVWSGTTWVQKGSNDINSGPGGEIIIEQNIVLNGGVVLGAVEEVTVGEQKDDWIIPNFNTSSIISLTGGSNESITGIDSTGVDQHQSWYFINDNTSNKKYTFINNSGDSLAANRLDLKNNVILEAGEVLFLMYSPVRGRFSTTPI